MLLLAATAVGIGGACGGTDDNAGESTTTPVPATTSSQSTDQSTTVSAPPTSASPAVASTDEDARDSTTTPDPVTTTDRIDQSTTDSARPTITSTTLASAEPWILYSLVDGSGPALVHPDGADNQAILTESGGVARHVAWSPDGFRLAFDLHHDHEEIVDLWVSNGDGSEPQLVLPCSAPCMLVQDPAWSPSGDQLLVIRYDGPPIEPGFVPTTSTVELLDLSTGERRDVLQSAYPDLLSSVEWSPDAASYVVSIERFGADSAVTGSAIAIGGVDGSPLRQLTEFDQWAIDADWHPSADLLVYNTHDLSAPLPPDGTANLFTIRTDGTDPRQVTMFEPGDTGAVVAHWTPDGERILFTQVDGLTNPDPAARSVRMASIKPDGTELEWMPAGGLNGIDSQLQPPPG